MEDRFRVPEEIAVRVTAEDMHATLEANTPEELGVAHRLG
jgi:hypothetical protein